jgi:hypothetical protein
MAETTRLKLPYPVASEDVSLGPKTFEAQAKLIDELMVAQNLVAHATSATAKVGELLKMTATATVTLPAASVNAIVGVICASGETTIKMTGAKIFGDFITGAESIKLLLNQHVILQSDGTNWYIIAGEPKRQNVYEAGITVTAEVEHEVSSTRDGLVTLSLAWEGKTNIEILVGGVKIGRLGNPEVTTSATGSITFKLPSGAKYKVKVITGTAPTIEQSFILL